MYQLFVLRRLKTARSPNGTQRRIAYQSRASPPALVTGQPTSGLDAASHKSAVFLHFQWRSMWPKNALEAEDNSISCREVVLDVLAREQRAHLPLRCVVSVSYAQLDNMS